MLFSARATSCAAAAVALLIPLPAVAQAASASDPNIVVRAERDPPTQREIGEQARNISIIGSPLDDPLPRFEDRVCPGVLGMKDEDAAYIIQRIRHNAEQFDIRLHKDDGKCEPNFIVAFVEDAQGQMAQLARRQGYMLAGMSVSARGELVDAPGAARVWTNTVMRTNTGAPAPSRSSKENAPERVLSYAPETGVASSIAGMPPEARGSASHSRIYFPLREDIYSVLVLFDREQVRDKTLLQLADYATMRGLAFTRETRGEVPADTILSLFDGAGPKPARLTTFDLGYLGSLYDGIPNMPATSKLNNVRRHMERQVAAAAEEADGSRE
jgi:hypothetical protein